MGKTNCSVRIKYVIDKHRCLHVLKARGVSLAKRIELSNLQFKTGNAQLSYVDIIFFNHFSIIIHYLKMILEHAYDNEKKIIKNENSTMIKHSKIKYIETKEN